jgi:hypothetical protein
LAIPAKQVAQTKIMAFLLVRRAGYQRSSLVQNRHAARLKNNAA